MRLMNLGRTSPSSPAASSSAASHKESTVPTSCAKHSAHVLSGFGLPSNIVSVGVSKRSCGSNAGMARLHTGVLIIQLQKVAFMIQLVRVAVEQRENGLQLRDGVLVDLHDGRLIRLDHGHGSCTVPRTISVASGRSVDVYRGAIVGLRRRRGRAAQVDVRKRMPLLDLAFCILGQGGFIRG